MKSWLASHAKQLRKSSTEAERVLWHSLRARQIEGLKFRRQQPIGGHIVDFACLEKALVIEVDGGQHGEDAQAEKDGARDRWLESEGFTVLRFWNHDVLSNTEGVLETIRRVCLDGPSREGAE
jgi:very-short-patch-repair endonuclease